MSALSDAHTQANRRVAGSVDLDLIAHLPEAAEPPAEGVARAHEMLEQIAGAEFATTFSGTDVPLIGTGRRAPTDAEKVDLGRLVAKIPAILT
ncbi:hypothetical protein OHA72_46135 [Dactylosporangium sp. NBC_01737]|uniref:hypothetical protein n=1 Tax=Dactylosporangium sp. NBC_01737 TaxID=2975959 RepID=UPI002E0FCD4A|nr:hypothetical protein OHA72_46135 [Dactylosporangium sp. NBC_01737]